MVVTADTPACALPFWITACYKVSNPALEYRRTGGDSCPACVLDDNLQAGSHVFVTVLRGSQLWAGSLKGHNPEKKSQEQRVVVLGAISEDPVCPRVCGAAWEAELVKGGGLCLRGS